MRSSALLLIGMAAAAPVPAAVSFNRDIRPIMSDTCFRCHGPDKSTRMAGLRLDLRDEALKPLPGGQAPIVPGDPAKSAIIERIFTTNAAKIMPPKFAHKELSEKQKQTVRQWVAEGAKYESHWAYQPVARPEPPGRGHPVDAFVRARLALEGLTPSPEAGRSTLLRRVSLDLTGLPPAPAEVDAFVKDTSADAYEKVVDRLLASPRYAEKQTMLWLDAVRYADTCGFHGDNPYPAWPYRDYVLRSFRDNKPFDEFTREQLAGDLMPGATVEQKVASAYNRILRTSAEGGLQPKEYLAKYGADRVRTLAAAWLGSTIGCSECHDHKFDPFTARDFYSMKAFFADLKETGLVPDRGDKAWGVQMTLPSDEQKQQLAALTAAVEAARAKMAAARDAMAERLAAAEKDLRARYEAGELAWKFQRPVSARSANGAKLTIYNDEPVENTSYTGPSLVTEKKPGNGLVVISGPNPDNETYSITFRPGAGTWTAVGVQLVQDESLLAHRIARGSDRLVVTEVEADLEAAPRAAAKKLAFSLAADNLPYPSADFRPVSAIDGDGKTGWAVVDPGNNVLPFLALRLSEAVTTTASSMMTVRIRHDSEFRRATAGRLRVALSAARHSWPKDGAVKRALDDSEGGLPDEALKALKTVPSERTKEQAEALRDYLAWSTDELTALHAEVARIESERGRLDASIPRVVVSESGEPEMTRVLARGNWMDDSGDVVQPAIPAFLGKLETPGRATRLDLANWLVSPENPLTARVFANRMWRQFFGTGLSKVLDDLGSQGELPKHAELLDWLASEFVEPKWNAEGAHRWDVKHLLRTIVLSETYRQSSLSNPKLEELDPDNRLLARQNRFRVEAETVRDVALASSGLLVEKFGGPSVKPWQPDGYLAALNFPKRDYSASRGDDLYRRGVYTHWQRTFLHPSMMTFDAPSREECTVNRVSSNTPLQALVLLNDPIYLEAARVFAQNVIQDGGATFDARLNWAFRRTVSRRATVAERKALGELYEQALARYRTSPASARQLLKAGEARRTTPKDPAEAAAWMLVTRAILNLHETVTRN